MAKHKYSLGLLLVFCGCAGTILLSTLHTQSQNKPATKQQAKISRGTIVQAEEIDTSNFPVADYLAARPSNAKEFAKREAKGKRYNSQYAPPINESADGIYATIDWDVGLPAFPIDKSAAVIVGTITGAKAYLSENKTNIYSEFEVQIDEVLKSENGNLTAGSLVVLERAGGRVRLPSGKIVASIVSHQQLPQVGSQYLLFLTHENFFGAALNEDFAILTGYEFRDGRIFPLDKTLPGHPITAYKGADEVLFLKHLNSALTSRLHSK
jgi:hypothetical protein